MTKEIQAFLERHYVLVLSTCNSNQPYSAPLFYIFFENFLFFLSDIHTRHSQEIINNKNISASIFEYISDISQIKGIQLTGNCFLISETSKIDKELILNSGNKEIKVQDVYQKYINKFEIAKKIPSYLWCIEPILIKYTDNSIHFGYKTIWRKK